ncbi:MAG: type II toxin-antitoxin system VapC family toxin [Aeromicrobium sp.]|uniref:type II toxin-antitoxin system VapC family toxin n=1 Tax=Aeromicrobium sp. TaxID=1871063 RepID=UPI0039E27C27
MIVLDTSAAIELLLSLPRSRQVQEHVERADWRIAAPQLLVIEALQVLRRRVAAGLTSLDEGEEARELLGQLGIRYFDHQLLADRVWQLRDNLTAYDASFVALAELLDAELVTTDARLAGAPGHAARTTVVA